MIRTTPKSQLQYPDCSGSTPPLDDKSREFDPPLDDKSTEFHPSLDEKSREFDPPLDDKSRDWTLLGVCLSGPAYNTTACTIASQQR